jgi:hypothetical protein
LDPDRLGGRLGWRSGRAGAAQSGLGRDARDYLGVEPVTYDYRTNAPEA